MADLSIFKLDSQTITIKDTTARQAAESAKTLATTASGNATTALNKINELESEKADTIISSTSGAIASFPDGAARPVDDLTVQIEPVQDLHGYDHPWPAGGGKNLFYHEGNKSVTANGLTATFDGDTQTISITGTNTGTSSYVLLSISCTGDIPRETPLARAILNAPSGTYMNFVYRKNRMWYNVNNGGVIPTDIDENTVIDVQLGIHPSATTINATGLHVQIEQGSTAPTEWTPYSNICTISGYDSVSVWDDPVYGGTIRWNQLLSENQAVESYSKFGLTFAKISGKMGFNVTGTFNFESGDRNAYIYRQSHQIAIIKDHVYCIAYDSKYATVYCYGAQFSGNWIEHAPHGGSIIKATNSANLYLSLNFGSNISNGTVFNEEILINLFDLTEMFGEEKADEIYALDMQSPRGQGVTWFKALFPNNYYEPDDSYAETCVSAVNGDPYRQVEVDFPSEAGTVYGGSLDVTTGVLTVDRAQIASYAGETLSSTWISDRDVYSAEATPTTGAQVVYELAQPQTYQLTPQEITTLLGQNNIWADTGDMSVTYRADTKLYIDNKFTELQALILEKI